MDRRIDVSNSELKAIEQSDVLLADVCCNNTTPAGDLVGLCGVFGFQVGRNALDIASSIGDALTVVLVSVSAVNGSDSCEKLQLQMLRRYGSLIAISQAMWLSL